MEKWGGAPTEKKKNSTISPPPYQSQNACTQPAGTCLANQLMDLAAADAAREAAGKGPLHKLARWGGGQAGARQAFRRAAAGPLWLGLPLPSSTSSLVTLALDAADLQFVTSVASGVIEAVAVCARPPAGGGAGTLLPPPANPAGCAAASFQALSGAGVLAVTLRNTGALAAQFTVVVANCTGGVLDPPAAVAALRPGAAGVLEFPLASTSAAAVADAACGVALLDAAGTTTASVTAAFAINATDIAPPPVDPGNGGKGTGAGRGTPACAPACALPPSWWARFVCRLLRRCWRDLLASAVTGLAIAGGVGLLILGCVKGWWWGGARAVVRACCGRSRVGRHV